MIDLYDQLYQALCKECPSERRCHTLCRKCEKFNEELERLEKGDNECQDKD